MTGAGGLLLAEAPSQAALSQAASAPAPAAPDCSSSSSFNSSTVLAVPALSASGLSAEVTAPSTRGAHRASQPAAKPHIAGRSGHGRPQDTSTTGSDAPFPASCAPDAAAALRHRAHHSPLAPLRCTAAGDSTPERHAQQQQASLVHQRQPFGTANESSGGGRASAAVGTFTGGHCAADAAVSFVSIALAPAPGARLVATSPSTPVAAACHQWDGTGTPCLPGLATLRYRRPAGLSSCQATPNGTPRTAPISGSAQPAQPAGCQPSPPPTSPAAAPAPLPPQQQPPHIHSLPEPALQGADHHHHHVGGGGAERLPSATAGAVQQQHPLGYPDWDDADSVTGQHHVTLVVRTAWDVLTDPRALAAVPDHPLHLGGDVGIVLGPQLSASSASPGHAGAAARDGDGEAGTAAGRAAPPAAEASRAAAHTGSALWVLGGSAVRYVQTAHGAWISPVPRYWPLGQLVEVLECQGERSNTVAPAFLFHPQFQRLVDVLHALRDEFALLGLIVVGILLMLSSLSSPLGMWLGVTLEGAGCIGLLAKAVRHCSWPPH